MSLLTAHPLQLAFLVLLFATSVGAIVWVIMAGRQRHTVLRRALGTNPTPIVAIKKVTRSPFAGIADWLVARVPAQLGVSTVSASRLVHAGFESDAAPPLFLLLRLASLVVCTTLGFILATGFEPVIFGLIMVSGVAMGLVLPTIMLDRMVDARRQEIRRAIPDTLDLLVVCVEAGVALDAAIQRVARELLMLHPMLADELLGMSRRVSAGMAREQAMHGLYVRTGVEELRGLASHLLQSEKWGTSIVTVLRLYSEQLRHRRRIAAEKRAATASTRMLIPLALFIFPTLFVVLLGPAIMRISMQF